MTPKQVLAEKIKIRKNQLGLELVFKYHPKWKKLKDKQEWLDRAQYVDVPSLVELTMAELGDNLVHHSGTGKDFTDGTDCKFICTQAYSRKGLINIRVGSHTGVSHTGVSKQGALRLVLYNHIKNKLEFFFVPKSYWSKNLKNTNVHMVFYQTFSRIGEPDNAELTKYKVATFNELVNKT